MSDNPDENPSVEVRIGDDPTPRWMRREAINRREGPIMPEPDHDDDPFADSYAHLGRDGNIRRYHTVIGHWNDIKVIEAKGAT